MFHYPDVPQTLSFLFQKDDSFANVLKAPSSYWLQCFVFNVRVDLIGYYYRNGAAAITPIQYFEYEELFSNKTAIIS